jgi:signal transduction histidine kinase
MLPEDSNQEELAGRYQDGRSGRRWIVVVLVLAVGLSATIAVWRAVGTHEQSELRWATKLAAQAIRTDLLTDMEWQVIGLDRLAMLWEAADPPQNLWTRNAELYIRHRPGCVAVEWFTRDGEQRLVVSAAGKKGTRPLAFDGDPKALIEAVARSRIAMISAPESVSDGSRQWVVAYPVYASSQARGFIVAFFDLEESLDYILNDVRPLEFSFGVSAPNQAEYVLPGTSRKYEEDLGIVVAVPLPGTTWQLRVWPNADVVNEIRSKLPEVALTVGIAVSLLLALTLYFGIGASLSSARSRRATEELRREISTREGAQEELRRAHGELELRIDRRTGELAASNALLQKEVTEHQRAEELLRELTGRLFQLQDEERRRLARELHDGAVQNLDALALDVAMVREAVPAEDLRTNQLVRECSRLIEQSMGELRTISYLLHPPYLEELGLPAALRDFVEGFATRSGIQVTLEIDPKLGRLGRLELAIYRVVQEALSNVHRHAQSRTATITLARNAELVQLEIADAGRGIPPEVLAPSSSRLAGVGIAGMRERVRLLGGRLEMQSSSSGTRIQVVLPVTASDLITGKGGSSSISAAGGGSDDGRTC